MTQLVHNNSAARRGLNALVCGLAILASLSACDEGAGGGATKSAPGRVVVANGTITVAGPSGYCIDTSESRSGSNSAFVLLGSCASLSGSANGQAPKSPAILTATISAGGGDAATFAANLPAMARFVSSRAGRKALSRSGNASSVEIIEISTANSVMYIRVRDRAAANGREVEPEYWRALMSAKGQIITLSTLGLREKALSSDVKLGLLKGFVARMKAANSG